MADGREKEYEAIADNLSRFIMIELRNDFPEINGFGVGVKTEEFLDRDLNSISQEEAYKHLGFIILLEKAYSEERMKQMKLRIAEKMLKFIIVGKVEPLKS